MGSQGWPKTATGSPGGPNYTSWPLWAVDREFVSIYLVRLASLWCLWNAFGFLWRDFELDLVPFGVHLAPLEVLVAPFGVDLVPFGLHLAPLGGPFGCLWGAREGPGAVGGSLGCLGAYSMFL